jgi:hypothetical protein
MPNRGKFKGNSGSSGDSPELVHALIVTWVDVLVGLVQVCAEAEEDVAAEDNWMNLGGVV